MNSLRECPCRHIVDFRPEPKWILILLILTLLTSTAMAQTGTGWLKGQVKDQSGAAVVKATITAVSDSGLQYTAISDRRGHYEINGLAPGKYAVSAGSIGFAPWSSTEVDVPALGRALNIELEIEVNQEQVTVEAEGPHVDVAPSNNSSATVIRGSDLNALSDDPQRLQRELKILAGFGDPGSGQIYVDGFANGHVPPKASIREVRVNQNPFSAQFDHPGYGRIEVFTNPGTEDFHGEFSFTENNSVFNSKSPFATTRPDSDTRALAAALGGPLTKKASFFAAFMRMDDHDASLVNALAPDTLQPYRTAVASPGSFTDANVRMDYRVAENNTLTAHYDYGRNTKDNEGVGSFSLPSQALNSQETSQSLQISDSQILSPRVVNETRFQYLREEHQQLPIDRSVAINVQQAFTSGGNSAGESSDRVDRYELQNYTFLALGKHFIKFGGQLSGAREAEETTNGFNGTFIFDSLSAYQAGQPSQFLRTFGTPSVAVNYADLGLYAEDDWQLKPNLTFSYGLRYETQNTIADHSDFAPRLGISWGLGTKTILRAGWGIFYDRFDRSLMLETARLNGINQTQYTVLNPEFYPTVPDQDELSADTASLPTIRRIDPRLKAPYTMQTSLSVERQISKSSTISLTYRNSHTERALLSENINAPAPYDPADACANRPLGICNNVYQYGSKGSSRRNQLTANFRSSTQRISLFGMYTLKFSSSDIGGANSFPATPLEIAADYGRASSDIRHQLVIGGSLQAPHDIAFSPFVVVHSGAPYNITIGQDLNGDSQFNERPAFAGANAASPVPTIWGLLDTIPQPGEKIVPVNYGKGPAFYSVDLRVSKTFKFGAESSGNNNAPQLATNRSHGRGATGLAAARQYDLTLSATAENLTNHVNYGPPISNLSSPLVGQTTTIAGDSLGPSSSIRRLFVRAEFSF